MATRAERVGEILVLEDEEALAELLSLALTEAGYSVRVAHTLAAARALMGEVEFDVSLLDLHLPDGSSLELLEGMANEGSATETIVVTGSQDVPSAIQAMKLGASDYLVKPASMADIERSVELAIERRRLRNENRTLRLRLERYEPPSAIVTEDPGLRRLIESLQQVGPSDLPVIVQGESGTGKELIARAVHDASRRRAEAFVAINCAAMPDTLLESELFGYEKGAFTGAVARKPGLFEVADRGTLFLDEIGDVSPSMQVKLLRVLETQESMRLGATKPTHSDVRIVSASNKDLSKLMLEGAMREDLYYRLNGITLRLPPLRERSGDILPLALHFLRKYGSKKGLSPSALSALKAYRWPGNVRELQMVIRRAAAMAPGAVIEPSDILLAPRSNRSSTSTFEDGLTLAELEEKYIRHVLDQCQGHRGEAAAMLGVTPKTLYNRLGPEKPRRKSVEDRRDRKTSAD